MTAIVPIDNGACFLCLSPDTAYLRLDKKGRPYVSCHSCGSKLFITSPRVVATVQWLMDNGVSYAKLQLQQQKSVHQPVAGAL